MVAVVNRDGELCMGPAGDPTTVRPGPSPRFTTSIRTSTVLQRLQNQHPDLQQPLRHSVTSKSTSTGGSSFTYIFHYSADVGSYNLQSYFQPGGTGTSASQISLWWCMVRTALIDSSTSGPWSLQFNKLLPVPHTSIFITQLNLLAIHSIEEKNFIDVYNPWRARIANWSCPQRLRASPTLSTSTDIWYFVGTVISRLNVNFEGV